MTGGGLHACLSGWSGDMLGKVASAGSGGGSLGEDGSEGGEVRLAAMSISRNPGEACNGFS